MCWPYKLTHLHKYMNNRPVIPKQVLEPNVCIFGFLACVMSVPHLDVKTGVEMTNRNKFVLFDFRILSL